jgi:hypothetical protein
MCYSATGSQAPGNLVGEVRLAQGIDDPELGGPMNLRLVSLLAVCLSVLFASCVSLTATTTPTTTQTTTQTTNAPDAVQSAQGTIDAVIEVQPSGIPDHFLPAEPAESMRTESDFDANSYFSVLDHLSMKPDYVLDYLYIYDGMGGYPLIYARRSEDPPYASSDEYAADIAEGGQDLDEDSDYYYRYLNSIQSDDTREGYFQFVVLYIMGGQFYLDWHAGYNDTTIVCDGAGLESALSAADACFEGDLLPDSLREKAEKLDLEPTVEFPDTATAVVRLVTFSKWGGFVELRYTISRQFSHSLIEVDTKILIEYDCGVSF